MIQAVLNKFNTNIGRILANESDVNAMHLHSNPNEKSSRNEEKRKLKIDRRLPDRDRRTETSSNYDGPSRRMTIDRRRNIKDRRTED